MTRCHKQFRCPDVIASLSKHTNRVSPADVDELPDGPQSVELLALPGMLDLFAAQQVVVQLLLQGSQAVLLAEGVWCGEGRFQITV